MAVYDSYDFSGSPWQQYGGTSLACPCWAGLIAIADQFRSAAGMSLLSSNSSNGSNYWPRRPSTACTACPPRLERLFPQHHQRQQRLLRPWTGYDMATGIGTPIANVLVPAWRLAGARSDREHERFRLRHFLRRRHG